MAASVDVLFGGRVLGRRDTAHRYGGDEHGKRRAAKRQRLLLHGSPPLYSLPQPKINFSRVLQWSVAHAQRNWPCEAAGLLQDRLTEAHQTTLYGAWQIPMYELDFSPIPVSLEELQAKRDAAWRYVI